MSLLRLLPGSLIVGEPNVDGNGLYGTSEYNELFRTWGWSNDASRKLRELGSLLPMLIDTLKESWKKQC